jgi:hypothetical protein
VTDSTLILGIRDRLRKKKKKKKNNKFECLEVTEPSFAAAAATGESRKNCLESCKNNKEWPIWSMHVVTTKYTKRRRIKLKDFTANSQTSWQKIISLIKCTTALSGQGLFWWRQSYQIGNSLETFW